MVSIQMSHTRSHRPHLGRVLVVDDDPTMRRVCARVLGSEGWEVTLVESGKSALATVR